MCLVQEKQSKIDRVIDLLDKIEMNTQHSNSKLSDIREDLKQLRPNTSESATAISRPEVAKQLRQLKATLHLPSDEGKFTRRTLSLLCSLELLDHDMEKMYWRNYP